MQRKRVWQTNLRSVLQRWGSNLSMQEMQQFLPYRMHQRAHTRVHFRVHLRWMRYEGKRSKFWSKISNFSFRNSKEKWSCAARARNARTTRIRTQKPPTQREIWKEAQSGRRNLHSQWCSRMKWTTTCAGTQKFFVSQISKDKFQSDVRRNGNTPLRWSVHGARRSRAGGRLQGRHR